jgi:succinate dehydrogenase/fumarate reductase iron-sulfur protein
MVAASSTMAVTLRVRRSDGGPELFPLEAGPFTSVLDLLFAAQRRFDRSLVFRFACRIGVCGSCAVRINGREGLACRTRVVEVGQEITLEPLRHLPVVRDLAVDLRPFRAAYTATLPALRPTAVMRAAPAPQAPVLPELGGRGDCIACAACYSASETVATVPGYPGAAALLRAASLLADPRDGAHAERAAALTPWLAFDDPGATAVCPKGLRHEPALAWLRDVAARAGPNAKE